MEDSQNPSLSRRRRGLVHAGNITTATTIPFDLIIEILSLLPAKSLFRFQSVSKLWFSTIRSKTFVDLFQTRSKARPRLLFTLYHKDSQKQFILSAPEYNNKDDDKTSSVMARYDMMISDIDMFCGSVNGFVCFIGKDCNTIYVYNPTTRQVVKLPDAKPNGRIMVARLGYDPVEDQYKVFCIMFLTPKRQNIQQEHLVCTVSSSHEEQEWRKIENPTRDDYHYVFFGQTCIDGALYFAVGPQSRILRFDVRSEKIDFIKRPEETSYISATSQSIFTNYKGKLGGLKYSSTKNLLTLWILDNAEKQEWSSMTFALSSKLEDLIAANVVSLVVIHTGELMVFRPWLESSKPFYVCYYDFNKKSTRRVEIRGIEDGDLIRFHGIDHMLCNAGHIENIRFL